VVVYELRLTGGLLLEDNWKEFSVQA